MFWSDLGPNVGYEAIGLVDSSLQTVAVFAKKTLNENTKNTSNIDGIIDDSKKEPISDEKTMKEVNSLPAAIKEESIEDFGKGVVFYLKNDKIVGILLWNLFNRINIARKVLSQDLKYDDLNEVAKLFDVYEQN